MEIDKTFGIGKILVLVGAVLIFVCTFLPWFSMEISGYIEDSETENAWHEDISLFIESEDVEGTEDSVFWFGALIFLLLTLGALVFAFLDIGPRKIILIVIGGCATLFYAINAFFGTPSDSFEIFGTKMEYGPGFGLYLGLVSGIILLVGAILFMKQKGGKVDGEDEEEEGEKTPSEEGEVETDMPAEQIPAQEQQMPAMGDAPDEY